MGRIASKGRMGWKGRMVTKTRLTGFGAAAGILVLLLGIQLGAHHSFAAEFDAARPVEYDPGAREIRIAEQVTDRLTGCIYNPDIAAIWLCQSAMIQGNIV